MHAYQHVTPMAEFVQVIALNCDCLYYSRLSWCDAEQHGPTLITCHTDKHAHVDAAWASLDSAVCLYAASFGGSSLHEIHIASMLTGLHAYAQRMVAR